MSTKSRRRHQDRRQLAREVAAILEMIPVFRARFAAIAAALSRTTAERKKLGLGRIPQLWQPGGDS